MMNKNMTELPSWMPCVEDKSVNVSMNGQGAENRRVQMCISGVT